MNERRGILTFAAILMISLGLAGGRAFAATPSFAISAGNVTMSAAGSSVVTFTLTSVDGYSGSVNVICNPVNAPAGASLPLCGQPSVVADPKVYTLAANATVQGSFPLLASFPSCSGNCPVKLDRPRRGLPSGLALAGALVGFGLSFRRRAARWLVLTLVALGTLAGMAGIGACGGSGKTLTPGVWPYVVQAGAQGSNETASATINVTVPPGIPVTN
jgi:hypothetical protein